MPVYVSGSDGITTISGSSIAASGSGGETSYGPTETSSSAGSTLSGSSWPFYAGAHAAGTSSYPNPTTGAMCVVSGTGHECHQVYIYVGAQYSGPPGGVAGSGWILLTGSSGCVGPHL